MEGQREGRKKNHKGTRRKVGDILKNNLGHETCKS